jgi:TM2 domain-containing membrane protein YozV
MVGQIGPLVQAGKRLRIVASHVAGGLAGGLVIGILVGLLAAIIHEVVAWPREFVLAGLCSALLVAAASDARLVRPPYIWTARQTPRTWGCSFGSTPAVFAWGFDLGLVFTTRLTSFGVLVLPAFVLLNGSFIAAVGIFTAFAVTRAAVSSATALYAKDDLGEVCSRLRDSQRVRGRVAVAASSFLCLVVLGPWVTSIWI